MNVQLSVNKRRWHWSIHVFNIIDQLNGTTSKNQRSTVPISANYNNDAKLF
jgi:hypothetical protein